MIHLRPDALQRRPKTFPVARRFLVLGVLLGAGINFAMAQTDDLFVGTIPQGRRGAGSIVRVTPAGTDATFANIDRALAMAVDSQGTLYISAEGGAGGVSTNIIYKLDKTGKATVFTYGPPQSGLTNTMMAFDAVDNLYAGSTVGVVYKISPSGVFTVLASGMGLPAGLAFDAGGVLFVSDDAKGTISKVDTATGAITPYASGIASPQGLAFDASGDLMVASYGGDAIMRITRAGVATPFAHVPRPGKLAFDSKANLYVTSSGPVAVNAIYKVDKSGAVSLFYGFSGGMRGLGAMAFNRPLVNTVAAKSSSTGSKPTAIPSPGDTNKRLPTALIIALCIPAIILTLAALCWLVVRKK